MRKWYHIDTYRSLPEVHRSFQNSLEANGHTLTDLEQKYWNYHNFFNTHTRRNGIDHWKPKKVKHLEKSSVHPIGYVEFGNYVII